MPADFESPRLVRLPGRWPVVLGTTYTVFALSQQDGHSYATFEHAEQEFQVSEPLALFEIADPAVPSIWVARVANGEMSSHPPEFDDEFSCDDVQERRGNALDRDRALKARLG